jgi:hypothetical protein
LAFRDYLRTHPDVAAEYTALKSDLARATGRIRTNGTPTAVAKPTSSSASRNGRERVDSARGCAPDEPIIVDTKR